MAPETKDAAAPAAARRVALLLEYDGACFAGSQLQSNAVTVQGVLEGAIERATGESSRVAFAGRTDAGVHARGQVASFVTSSRLDGPTLQRALNAWLRDDVVVRAVSEVEMDFDPRRDGRQRHYRYVIDNGAVRPALDRGRAWHVPGALNLEAMSAATQAIVGRHDFAAFASRLEDPGASTVRELSCFTVDRKAERLEFDLVANAFLPHQVRRMVGALVEVGRCKLTPEQYAALLNWPPASAGPAAPPHGLYLIRVEYERPLFGAPLSGESC
jgi:tRNA pseudouridine38-40 synthase